MITVPTLRGDLVTLRPFEMGDVDYVVEAGADAFIPLITTVPSDADVGQARAFVERQWSRATTGAGYSFAVAETRSGRAIGQIGLWLHDIRDGRASIGYWIVASMRRRGLAAAALTLLSQWAVALAEVDRLELYVEPWNEGSWRAAESVGFEREGLLRSWQRVGDERRDMFMYSLLATR